jgi:quinol monooxygenase YgiN
MPLIIYVEFAVKAAAVERFRALILENARKSLAHEPGCRRFDVLIDGAVPNRIVLYEIYKDAAAFDAHMATAHYKAFAVAADELLEARRVERLVFLDATLDRDAERKTAQHPTV